MKAPLSAGARLGATGSAAILEEIVVPCWGRKLEAEVLPAVKAALFVRDLEPLASLVREVAAAPAPLKAEVEKHWAELRSDILHGQIDYKGEGPLPEHWKQYIDKETNYYDWRHPKWAQDAEALVVDLAVRAAERDGWQGEIRPAEKTSAGLVELIMEVGQAVNEAAPLADKFLEGMPEWLQHDNAYTGGYLTEDEVARMHGLLKPRAKDLEGALKGGALLGGWVGILEEAMRQKVGLSWTVPMLRA